MINSTVSFASLAGTPDLWFAADESHFAIVLSRLDRCRLVAVFEIKRRVRAI
jgi:hypothetical protein